MAGVNKHIILGNLGRDPDVRRTQDGRPVVSFSVATGESWKDKATGEKREKTEWHRVVIFSESLAKVAEQYLKKGSKVYIEGPARTRSYTDKDGVERFTTEIVLSGFNSALMLLDRKPDGRPPEASTGDYGELPGEPRGAGEAPPPTRAPAGGADDEIPF